MAPTYGAPCIGIQTFHKKINFPEMKLTTEMDKLMPHRISTTAPVLCFETKIQEVHEL
jgi:hypothetical protein